MATSSNDPIRDQARARRFWEDQLLADAREVPTGDWALLPESELMGITIELGRRGNISRFAIRNGTVTADHLSQLDELLGHYRKLALAARPENLSVTPDRVGQEAGQVMEMVADVAFGLGDTSRAIDALRAAAAHYRKVDRHDEAERCERTLVETERRVGNRGAELVADIAARLNQAAPGLDRGETLVELAELHVDSEDFHDARALLLAAEQELKPFADAITGSTVGDAFAAMLLQGEMAELQKTLRVRSLFRRLWIGLSVVLDDDEADGYLERVEQLDRTESEGDQDSVDFARRATEALRQQWIQDHGTEPPDPASSDFSQRLQSERARHLRGEMDDR